MSRKKTAEDTSFNPGEFDPAMQSQAAAVVQSVADSTRMPESSLDRELAERAEQGGYAGKVEKKQYKKNPDPFGTLTVSLSEDPKGPKARLLRSNDNEAMLIQFSENPGKEITDQIKAQGFRWSTRAKTKFADGAWVIDLEPGREWRNHAHADAVFQDIVNEIREKNGMGPYASGAAVA